MLVPGENMWISKKESEHMWTLRISEWLIAGYSITPFCVSLLFRPSASHDQARQKRLCLVKQEQIWNRPCDHFAVWRHFVTMPMPFEHAQYNYGIMEYKFIKAPPGRKVDTKKEVWGFEDQSTQAGRGKANHGQSIKAEVHWVRDSVSVWSDVIWRVGLPHAPHMIWMNGRNY